MSHIEMEISKYATNNKSKKMWKMVDQKKFVSFESTSKKQESMSVKIALLTPKIP
jgi:hypothetical protein